MSLDSYKPFGTFRDDKKELCLVGSGNYIMFPSATNADKRNNFLFSNCSTRDISRVLEAIYEKKQRRNCFIGILFLLLLRFHYHYY